MTRHLPVRPLHGLALVLLAIFAVSCTRVQARTEPVRPALQVPEPPAKVVVAPEPEPEPVETPVEIVPERRVAPARPPRSGSSRSAAPKPQPEEPPAAKPVEPKPGEPPARHTPSAIDRALEQKIRDRVAEARKILNGLTYPSLSSAARSQYDKARGFLDQAAKALGSADLTLADFLAEKGDTLARGLMR